MFDIQTQVRLQRKTKTKLAAQVSVLSVGKPVYYFLLLSKVNSLSTL